MLDSGKLTTRVDARTRAGKQAPLAVRSCRIEYDAVNYIYTLLYKS